ncbi:MAG: DHH family phosphoesterase [Deltaproteobacteria bacterium]|jgi:phosphoesterase RecJ-like protein|nr:DHH family phosphoesterase [Deltaproteobacteria bacterium]
MTAKATETSDNVSQPPESLLAMLRVARRVLIVGHQNPDGDALGSALALALALDGPGREVTVGLTGMVAKSLDFLTRGKKFVSSLDLGPDLAQRFDLMVLVDCLSPSRVWPEAKDCRPEAFPPYVAIDHHHSGQAPVNYRAGFIDHLASATGELVFKVIEALGAEFSPPIVEALLAALISDTGSFSQGNATSECLRQASVLVSLGGDIEHINQYLRRNWSTTRMRLLSESLATLALHHDGRMASMLLTQEMLDRTGSSLDEAEGLVEYPLLLSGVDVAALLKVNGHGQTRVSLRSRPAVDVRELARSQGGGGHRQAAAYLDDSPRPATALARLLPIVLPLLPQGKDG